MSGEMESMVSMARRVGGIRGLGGLGSGFIAAVLGAAACADSPVTPPVTTPDDPPFVDFDTIRIAGLVVTPEGSAPPAFEVHLMSLTDTSTVQVGAGGGRFDLSVQMPAGDTVSLLVLPADTAGFFPSLKRYAGRDAVEQKVLLLPSDVTIPAGRFAGERLDVSLQLAVAPDNLLRENGDGSFYGFQKWLQPGGAAGGVDPDPDLSLWTSIWPDDRLPLPVYFHHDGHNVQGHARGPISPADSILFWEAVHDLEDRLGLDAFRPVRKEDVPLDTLQGPFEADTVRLFAVGVQQIPEMAGLGAISGFASAAPTCPTFPGGACERFGPGVLYEGDVSLSSFQGAFPERVRWLVQHELVHVLGFGHSCFRPSVVAACRGGYDGEDLEGGDPNPLATRYDAAYLHWYRSAHELVATHRPHFGIVEALDGERHMQARRPVRRDVRCLWGDIVGACAP